MSNLIARPCIAVALAAAALTAGCASQPQIPDNLWIEMPAHMIEGIAVGQTLQGSGMRGYRFEAEHGRTDTITVRSTGADTTIGLHHAARYKADRSQDNTIAVDFSGGGQFGRFDPNGPHSEIVVTLPPDEDGVYYIWQSAMDSGFSITLSDGAVPAEDILHLPQPILGNTGKFMSPFTEDGTVAPWVEKGMVATVGSNVGRALGSLAARADSSSSLPLAVVAGLAGGAAGRQMAIQAAGGWQFIKDNSDLSFDDITDMARHLHYRNAKHPQYDRVLEATYGIYPELAQAMERVRQER